MRETLIILWLVHRRIEMAGDETTRLRRKRVLVEDSFYEINSENIVHN